MFEPGSLQSLKWGAGLGVQQGGALYGDTDTLTCTYETAFMLLRRGEGGVSRPSFPLTLKIASPHNPVDVLLWTRLF